MLVTWVRLWNVEIAPVNLLPIYKNDWRRIGIYHTLIFREKRIALNKTEEKTLQQPGEQSPVILEQDI